MRARPDADFLRARTAGWTEPAAVATDDDWLLDPTHPFYDRAEASFVTAFEGGEPVGRVAAVIHHEHNERWQSRDAFVAFFESVDEEAVSRALLAAVEEIAADKGLERLLATLNPSANYSVGVQVEGFDERPVPMLTANPPFYARCFEAAGYAGLMDWTAVRLMHGPVEEALHQLRPLRDEAVAAGTVCKPLAAARRGEWADPVRRLYNRSFEGEWGFVPMDEAEFDAYLDHLAPFWLDRWSFLACTSEGPAGFVCAVGEPACGAEASPAHILFLCVAPRARKSLAGVALAVETLEAFLRDGRREAEFHSNDESAYMGRLMADLGVRKAKTYRLYAKGVQR